MKHELEHQKVIRVLLGVHNIDVVHKNEVEVTKLKVTMQYLNVSLVQSNENYVIFSNFLLY